MRKTLKKLLILIVIVNFIGIITEGAAIGNTKTTAAGDLTERDRFQIIKEKGVITVATPLDDRTYFYINPKTNKMAGIDADIITEIAKRLGINKVETKKTPFSNLLERLNSDDSIDIASGGIYITPEREKLVAFTEPLYTDSEAIVVPTFSKINFISDLKDAVVGVEKGTVFVNLAERWKRDNLIKDIVVFDNTSELLNAISKEKINAGIADSVMVKYTLSKDSNIYLRILKDYATELNGKVGIAVRKKDTILLKALNEKINEMKADGGLYAILIQNGLDKSNMS